MTDRTDPAVVAVVVMLTIANLADECAGIAVDSRNWEVQRTGAPMLRAIARHLRGAVEYLQRRR